MLMGAWQVEFGVVEYQYQIFDRALQGRLVVGILPSSLLVQLSSFSALSMAVLQRMREGWTTGKEISRDKGGVLVHEPASDIGRNGLQQLDLLVRDRHVISRQHGEVSQLVGFD